MTQAPTAWTSTGPKSKPIFVNLHLLRELGAKMFDMGYAQLNFPTGSENQYVLPGLVVALNSVTNKYVPWVADASHGDGSDTAVGILNEPIDVTNWDRMVSPIYAGEAIEQNVYTEENAIGTVPAAVKTSLTHITWRA